MALDTKYTDNLVLKKSAFQNLLTNIKNYPVIDVDFIEKGEEDELYNDDIWQNYTESTPCIKITYGDSETTKGNIIFNNKNRKYIAQAKKEINRLEALRAELLELKARWEIILQNNEEELALKQKYADSIAAYFNTQYNDNKYDFFIAAYDLLYFTSAIYNILEPNGTLRPKEDIIDIVDSYDFPAIFTNESYEIDNIEENPGQKKVITLQFLDSTIQQNLITGLQNAKNINADYQQVYDNFIEFVLQYNNLVFFDAFEENEALSSVMQRCTNESNYDPNKTYFKLESGRYVLLTNNEITALENDWNGYRNNIYYIKNIKGITEYLDLNKYDANFTMSAFYNQIKEQLENLKTSIISIIAKNKAIAEKHIQLIDQDLTWLDNTNYTNEDIKDYKDILETRYIGATETSIGDNTNTVNIIGGQTGVLVKIDDVVYEKNAQKFKQFIGSQRIDDPNSEDDSTITTYIWENNNKYYRFQYKDIVANVTINDESQTINAITINANPTPVIDNSTIVEKFSIKDLQTCIDFWNREIEMAAINTTGHPLIHGYKYVKVGDNVTFENNEPSIKSYKPSRDELDALTQTSYIYPKVNINNGLQYKEISEDELFNGFTVYFAKIDDNLTFENGLILVDKNEETKPSYTTQYYIKNNTGEYILQDASELKQFDANTDYYKHIEYCDNNGYYEPIYEDLDSTFKTYIDYHYNNVSWEYGLAQGLIYEYNQNNDTYVPTSDTEYNSNKNYYYKPTYYYQIGEQRLGHINVTINGVTQEIGVKGLEYSDLDSLNVTSDMIVNGNILTGNGNIYATGGAILGSTYLGIRNFPSIDNNGDEGADKETAGFWYDGSSNTIYTRNITADDEINGTNSTLSNINLSVANLYNNNNSIIEGIQQGDIGAENQPWNKGYFNELNSDIIYADSIYLSDGAASLSTQHIKVDDISSYTANQNIKINSNIDFDKSKVGSWITTSHEGNINFKLHATTTSQAESAITIHTTNGAWGIGRLGGDNNNLYFTYGTNTNYNANPKNNEVKQAYITPNGYFYAVRVYHAVYNDYAEFRKTLNNVKPGQCVYDNDDGSLSISDKFLIPGAQIVSDTYGASMGYTDECQTPLAVAGRVLVYPYQDKKNYHAGMCVCSAPGGTVNIMSRKDIQEYPDCIIGIVSEIPNYEYWGTDNVKVDGRIWIKIK